MLFHYVAADEEGKMTEGDHEADALGDVLRFLGSKQLRPVSVKQMEKTKEGFFAGIFGGINTSDKSIPYEIPGADAARGDGSAFRDQHPHS